MHTLTPQLSKSKEQRIRKSFMTSTTLSIQATKSIPGSPADFSYSACVNILLFFFIVCIVHITDTTCPTENTTRHFISMIFRPISAGLPSFTSIILVVIGANGGYHSWFSFRNRRRIRGQDAISTGAVAIPIPQKFAGLIIEEPLGWRKLKSNTTLILVPPIPHLTEAYERHTFYTIPPTSRLRSDTLDIFSSSNRVIPILSLFQFIYSAYQTHAKYSQAINLYGLSSPYIFAIPYYYITFINLIKNAVQQTYPNVFVLSPRESLEPTNASIQDTHIDARQNIQPNGGIGPTSASTSTAQDMAIEFEDWLQTNYPQIDVYEYPALSFIAEVMHYSFALVIIVIWVGLLTHFKAQGGESKVLLLMVVIADPVFHLLWILMKYAKMPGIGRGAVNSMICISNFIGALWVAKSLYKIYKDN